MPKKIVKKEVEEKSSEDLYFKPHTEAIVTEPVVEETQKIVEEEAKPIVKEKKLPRGMVKVKVKVGTLSYEDGSYEKGETFIVARRRLKGFDPRFYEIIK